MKQYKHVILTVQQKYSAGSETSLHCPYNTKLPYKQQALKKITLYKVFSYV